MIMMQVLAIFTLCIAMYISLSQDVTVSESFSIMAKTVSHIYTKTIIHILSYLQ